MQFMLTQSDIEFLTDAQTYKWGPTFELSWYPRESKDVPLLVEALHGDEGIDASILRRLCSDQYHPWGARMTWTPGDLPPIGMTLDKVYRDSVGIGVWIYPLHMARCTGYSDLRSKDSHDPKIIAFHRAAMELTNRIHRTVPLSSAMFLDEVRECDLPESDGVLLCRSVAEAANWPHVVPPLKNGFRDTSVASVPLGWDPPSDKG